MCIVISDKKMYIDSKYYIKTYADLPSFANVIVVKKWSAFRLVESAIVSVVVLRNINNFFPMNVVTRFVEISFLIVIVHNLLIILETIL